jgi:hypothetical protein
LAVACSKENQEMKLRPHTGKRPNRISGLKLSTAIGRFMREGDGGETGGGDGDAAALKAKLAKSVDAEKKLRARLAEFDAKQSDIDKAAEDAATEAARAAADWKTLEAKLTKRAETAEAGLADMAGKYTGLKVDTALGAELIAAGVANPTFQKAALSLLKSGNKFDISDAGEISAGGSQLTDFVKTWAAGDEGKSFITNGNGGGGAPNTPGNNGGPNPKVAGNMGGTREERAAALASKYPELAQNT